MQMQGDIGEHLWWHGLCSTAVLPPLWQQNVACEEGRHALVTHGGIPGMDIHHYNITGIVMHTHWLIISYDKVESAVFMRILRSIRTLCCFFFSGVWKPTRSEIAREKESQSPFGTHFERLFGARLVFSSELPSRKQRTWPWKKNISRYAFIGQNWTGIEIVPFECWIAARYGARGLILPTRMATSLEDDWLSLWKFRKRLEWRTSPKWTLNWSMVDISMVDISMDIYGLWLIKSSVLWILRFHMIAHVVIPVISGLL